MKKQIPKIEAPAIIKNENDAWHYTCDATVEKFNRVPIVTSNPKLNIDVYRRNYSLIDWKPKKAMNGHKTTTITKSVIP
jgi:hypothetical protein